MGFRFNLTSEQSRTDSGRGSPLGGAQGKLLGGLGYPAWIEWGCHRCDPSQEVIKMCSVSPKHSRPEHTVCFRELPQVILVCIWAESTELESAHVAFGFGREWTRPEWTSWFIASL